MVDNVLKLLSEEDREIIDDVVAGVERTTIKGILNNGQHVIITTTDIIFKEGCYQKKITVKKEITEIKKDVEDMKKTV